MAKARVHVTAQELSRDDAESELRVVVIARDSFAAGCVPKMYLTPPFHAVLELLWARIYGGISQIVIFSQFDSHPRHFSVMDRRPALGDGRTPAVA